jgi:hypothetical protein
MRASGAEEAQVGFLIHGRKGVRLAIEDRALAHLQIVMIGKLRQGEAFAFSWTATGDEGVERGTMWLHPSSTLRFWFAGSRIPPINPQWVAQLAELTDSDTGLHYLPEPTASLGASFASTGDDEPAGPSLISA